MKQNPLVSIIINNYNYGRFVREAIDSGLNQTYSHKEVIVVDDGSTDDSREIIASYGNGITSVLKENGGQASAFNAGFAVSKGDIICFLDADDIFLPEKVVEIVELFKCHQDIGWCFHTLTLLDNDTQTFIKNSNKDLSRQCDFRLHIKNAKLPDISTATSGLCFTRHLLQQILPMPEEIVITSDNYLKFAASALSKGFFLNKELVLQRIHGNNAYTLRNDKQQLNARIRIITAYWIRIKFPELSSFANALFVSGIAIYWRTGGIELEHREVVNKYFSFVPLLERLKIHSRAFYRSLRPREYS
jgi:glycosyltransferase involved in cell wall biosynthesis